MITASELRARVEKGIAWLDEYRPGWLHRIDLDRLELSSGCGCILGQEWLGDFPPDSAERHTQADEAFLLAVMTWGSGANCDGEKLSWARERGFWLDNKDVESYSALNIAWRTAILRERAERA